MRATQAWLVGGVLIGGMMPGALRAASWTILTQSRDMSAICTARIDAAEVTDTGTAAATDFGLFDAQVQARATLVDSTPGNERCADTSTVASQTSVLATNRITVSGFVGGSTFTNGPGTFGETDGFSNLFVQFEVTDPAGAKLTGVAESFDFGQVNISLTGPGVTFGDTVQGLNDFRTYDEEWTLDPGVYTFSVTTFADSAAGGGGSDGQSANWDLELTLLECPDPNDPNTLTNLVYAVAGGSDTVHRNIDLTGGLAWDSPGNIGAGASRGDGLAVHPITQVVYALVDIGGGQHLATIDPVTGALGSALPIINTDPLAVSDLADIAFRSDGVLFGLYSLFLPGLGHFGIVNLATGSVADAGLGLITVNSPDHALAFDPVSGLLYFTNGSTMNTIDVGTGVVTPVPLSVAPVFSSLAFHPSGLPFIANTNTGAIVRILPGAGVVTGLPGALDAPVPLTGMDYLPTLTSGGGGVLCFPADGDLGDTNGDGQVSGADLGTFVGCMTGPAGGIPSQSSCLHADMQVDGDVDLADFGVFSVAATNP